MGDRYIVGSIGQLAVSTEPPHVGKMAREWLRTMPSHGSGPFNESGHSYRARLVPSLAKAFRKAYLAGVRVELDIARTGRTSSAHPNPKIEVCADVRAGEFLVTCGCGKLRPNDKPCGWRIGQIIEWPHVTTKGKVRP